MPTTTVKIRRSDGKLVKSGPGGREIEVPVPSLRDMTEAEIEAAAKSDPDNPPRTEEQLRTMRRSPRIKVIRRAFGLTQEEFSDRYRIPLGTLRDWEQGRSEPDAPARAYLEAIAGDPEAVAKALSRKPAA